MSLPSQEVSEVEAPGIEASVATAAGANASENAPAEVRNGAAQGGHVLRPVFEAGRRYLWLQRMSAEVTVAGLGKQTMEWRQHFYVEAFADAEERGLEVGVDRVRVDLNVTGDRSRYYFDRSIPPRFQERTGLQGMLLRQTERLVRNRYRVLVTESGQHRLAVWPVVEEGGDDEVQVKVKEEEEETAWRGFPWEAVTSALLHQGIPAEALSEGARWNHAESLDVPAHGAGTWKMDCLFAGFKEHEGRRLALVKMTGKFGGEFFERKGVEESPGIAVMIPKIRGLTLIDVEKRQIVSTVLKLDGKLKSLGIDGTAENETAPIRQTLSVSLLGVEEEP